MTAVSVTDSSLTTQCLDFCQALAGHGKSFKISITIGSNFTFSLETKEGKATLPTTILKRKSPSTLKRNAKRREDFLAKKSTSESSSVVTGLESNHLPLNPGEAFQCDQCDASFKTVKGLKIHTGKAHKEASSPEKLRESFPQPSLCVSPIRDQSRIETCHNCDKDMSPSHLCQDDQDSTLDDVNTCECGCGSDFDPCPTPHHKHLGCAQSCQTCSNVQMQLQMVNLLKGLKDIVT